MPEHKARRERKKHKPPQVDSLDRGAQDGDDATLPRARRLPPAQQQQAGCERKWTVQQEIQLLKKRSSCLAHKWMHYRMAYWKSIVANLLGFPLVVLSGIATAAQYYAQLEEPSCSSSDTLASRLTTAGVLAMVFNTLVTILTAMVAWLKPAEAAEIHRQVSITYQALVDTIEDEMATKEEEREDGRFFMHDIENKMELLAQTAPNVPWFIMRDYTTDWADEREREIKIEDVEPDEPSGSNNSSANRASNSANGGSRSFRLERIDRSAPPRDDDDFDLMENFRQRLQSRMQQEQDAALQYQLERAQDDES